MSVLICRVCLTESATIYSIRNTQLQEVYEKLSGTKLIAGDRRPETVCYTCYSQLQRCIELSELAQKADSMLTQLFKDGIEITSDKVAELHNILVSINIKPPDSEHELKAPIDNLFEEIPIIVNDAIKQEPDPVKVEITETDEKYTDEDIKLEVEIEIDENDYTKENTSYLKNIETKVKETKYPEISLNNTCDNTFSGSLKKRIATTREKSFICTECSASFTVKSRLRQHMRCHAGKKSYSCNTCDKTFVRESALITHTKIHIGEKICACDRCGKTFLNKYLLKRHFRRHTGEKPYACDQCEKTFAESGNLKKHIATHAGKRPFLCTECNASFTLKGSLLRHMRSHTGEKLFFCDTCQKCLPDACHLRRHMRIHTGEKPYVCDACGKAYSDKANLKKHIFRHTGEKPYACKICDYKSAYKYCLKLHLKKHIVSS